MKQANATDINVGQLLDFLVANLRSPAQQPA